jgi:hypothetical protein
MFGEDDGPVIAAGPKGQVDGVWYVNLHADSPYRSKA